MFLDKYEFLQKNCCDPFSVPTKSVKKGCSSTLDVPKAERISSLTTGTNIKPGQTIFSRWMSSFDHWLLMAVVCLVMTTVWLWTSRCIFGYKYTFAKILFNKTGCLCGDDINNNMQNMILSLVIFNVDIMTRCRLMSRNLKSNNKKHKNSTGKETLSLFIK